MKYLSVHLYLSITFYCNQASATSRGFTRWCCPSVCRLKRVLVGHWRD